MPRASVSVETPFSFTLVLPLSGVPILPESAFKLPGVVAFDSTHAMATTSVNAGIAADAIALSPVMATDFDAALHVIERCVTAKARSRECVAAGRDDHSVMAHLAHVLAGSSVGHAHRTGVRGVRGDRVLPRCSVGVVPYTQGVGRALLQVAGCHRGVAGVAGDHARNHVLHSFHLTLIVTLTADATTARIRRKVPFGSQSSSSSAIWYTSPKFVGRR